MELSVDQMIKIGGKEWERGEDHRVYFSNDLIADLIELKIYRNSRGKVSSATLKGERISNSSVSNYLPGQFYYDVKEDKFFTIACGEELAQEIVDAMKARIENDA